MIFIIEGFQIIVFIFNVISTTFRPICPPALFTYFDSVSHNLVQVLSISVLLLVCSQDWTFNLQMIVSLEVKDIVRSSMKVPKFDKHLKKAGRHIVVEITMKVKTIVQKPSMCTYAKLKFLKWNCFCMQNWIVRNRTVYMYKKGFGINNLQWLMCHKKKKPKPNHLYLWWLWLAAFHGISTLVNYLMPNPVYIYIYIYIICKVIVCR